MVVEIFSICDAATDYGGRLNLLGAFEGIAAPKAPIVRDRCSLAVRMRFAREEVGRHAVAVRFTNKEGKQPIPDMKAVLNVKVAEGRESGTVNLVLNINRLTFPDFGTYEIQLFVDEAKQASLPLLVAKAKERKQIRNRMDN